MFELKTLSPEAVPRALAKAERYRLLNEPGEAQSICLDVLAVDPDNQEALATMILALTDQFGADPSRVHEALDDGRAACATTTSAPTTPASSTSGAPRRSLAHGTPRGGSRAYEWLRQAMTCYEEADAIRPPNNDDARLRWNACARLIDRNRQIAPAVDEPHEPLAVRVVGNPRTLRCLSSTHQGAGVDASAGRER